MTLDDLDLKILGELQEDGRRAFREIGRRLGVTERTIRVRVRRLQDEGALRIFAFVDPHALNSHVLAMLLVRIDSESHDAFVTEITSWPQVSYTSSLLTGRADLYVQVICRNNEELWELVTNQLRPLKGVQEVDVMIETAIHKFSYAYPGLTARSDPRTT